MTIETEIPDMDGSTKASLRAERDELLNDLHAKSGEHFMALTERDEARRERDAALALVEETQRQLKEALAQRDALQALADQQGWKDIFGDGVAVKQAREQERLAHEMRSEAERTAESLRAELEAVRADRAFAIEAAKQPDGETARQRDAALAERDALREALAALVKDWESETVSEPASYDAARAALADTAKAAAEYDERVRAEEREAMWGDQENVKRVLNGQPVAYVFSHGGMSEHDERVRREAVPWATGICSAHRTEDPLCRLCHPAIADHDARVAREAVESAAKRVESLLGVHLFSEIDVTATQRDVVRMCAAKVRATSEPAKAVTVPALPVDGAAERRIEKLLAKPAPSQFAGGVKDNSWDAGARPLREPAPTSGVCAACGGSKWIVETNLQMGLEPVSVACPDCRGGR